MSAEKHVYLDKGLRGWIVNTARSNHWRMASWYMLDDLIQDGYFCYAKCWDRYRELFDVPQPTNAQQRHFMALVQTAYTRHIATLASKSALGKEIPESQIGAPPGEFIPDDFKYGSKKDRDVNFFDKFMPPEPEQASLFCALSNLPTELADAMECLMQDGFDGGKYLRKKLDKQTRHKLRETTDQYWERVFGQPNIPEKLAAFLYD